MIGTKISGLGHYLPEKILTNKDLEAIVDTNDEWITTRTGIKQRHIMGDNEKNSDMSLKAAQMALKEAGLQAVDIDMIILGTSTPDMIFPATACIVQKKLGCRVNIPAFDYQIACASYTYGIIMAKQFIATGMAKNILILATDAMSHITDYTDRATCILFGDGAAAMILSASEEEHILGLDWGSNGYEPAEYLCTEKKSCNDKIVMDGPEVYRLAVKKMGESILQAIENSSIGIESIDYVIPHQANIRIMNSIVKHLALPSEKLINTIAQHGNTSGATVGLALSLSIQNGTIQRGQTLALTAFGAGLSWASVVIKY